MFRKDAIANKTLGETLLYFVTSVALRTNTKFSAQKWVMQDVATHIHTTLFNGNTNDAGSALTLAERFNEMAESASVLSNSYSFLKACATLCEEYYETVYHIHNEEADTLPF